MSRSGYNESDCCEDWALICYRGQVASAIRGKRGQAFLREALFALDALPEKKLCQYDLQTADGQCCTIGAVGLARGIDMVGMDPTDATDSGKLSDMFDIANQLVRELEWENDEGGRDWYAENVRDEKTGFPIYERVEHSDGRTMREAVYLKNADGVPVNKNGVTQEQHESKQDEIRFSRMRQWIKFHIIDWTGIDD